MFRDCLTWWWWTYWMKIITIHLRHNWNSNLNNNKNHGNCFDLNQEQKKGRQFTLDTYLLHENLGRTLKTKYLIRFGRLERTTNRLGVSNQAGKLFPWYFLKPSWNWKATVHWPCVHSPNYNDVFCSHLLYVPFHFQMISCVVRNSIHSILRNCKINLCLKHKWVLGRSVIINIYFY